MSACCWLQPRAAAPSRDAVLDKPLAAKRGALSLQSETDLVSSTESHEGPTPDARLAPRCGQEPVDNLHTCRSERPLANYVTDVSNGNSSRVSSSTRTPAVDNFINSCAKDAVPLRSVAAPRGAGRARAVAHGPTGNGTHPSRWSSALA